MEQEPQPDGPPRIERWPTAPAPRKSWAAPAFFAALFATLGTPFVLLASRTNTPTGMLVAGWLLLALALVCMGGSIVARRSDRRREPATRAEYEARRQRLTARWARVRASEFDARREGYAESGPSPLLGHEMLLELELLPSPDAREHSALAPEVLQVRHDFEPHLAGALVKGSLLEIAYDPLERSILPQRLLTPAGARFKVERELLSS